MIFLDKTSGIKKIFFSGLLIILSAAALTFAGCDLVNNKTTADKRLTNKERRAGVKMTKNGTRYLVNPSKLVAGGPPKDGIPAIDKPKFVSVKAADKWIKDDELVLGLTYKGEVRAYPLQIMVWHEVVNDKVAGVPLAVTYCPLCGSGIAYKRTINGKAVEFGVSGKLYNSNLVMYDRLTDSYWSQLSGEAIVGKLSGTKLSSVPLDTAVWSDWKRERPDSLVLSRDTGFSREYGRDPYGNYDKDTFVPFPLENKDKRIHPKTVVFGVEIAGRFRAYLEKDIEEKGLIRDSIAGRQLKIERDKAGAVNILDTNTGKKLKKVRTFWFAWYAFHPDTTVYGR